MYSHGSVAVDKTLGFDLSMLTDLVKTALPVSLNLYSQHNQLRQLQATGYPQYNPMQSAAQYMQPGQLPLSQYVGQQPTFGGQGIPMRQSQGMDTTTMALIGMGTLVAGLLAFKLLK